MSYKVQPFYIPDFNKEYLRVRRDDGLVIHIKKATLEIVGLLSADPKFYTRLTNGGALSVDGTHKCNRHVIWTEDMIVCEHCKEVIDI